jgi:hypothetical protein
MALISIGLRLAWGQSLSKRLNSAYVPLHCSLDHDGFQDDVDCAVPGLECHGRWRTVTKSSTSQYRIGETCQARDGYDNGASDSVSNGVPKRSGLLELEIDMLW